jgi:hypothetical protein
MKVTLLAKSSSGDPYEVEFAVDGECVLVFCHCKAGMLQWMCKHKLGLILGDSTMLFDASQANLLAQVRSWPQFARLEARVARYTRDLSALEAAKAEVAEKEKLIKAQFGRDLTRGGYTG